MTSSSAARPAHGALLFVILSAGLLVGGCATRRALQPKLEFLSLGSDRPSPQTADTTVRWRAEVRGGVGELNFEFRLRKGREETLLQSGPAPDYEWVPAEAGSYALRVTVRDSLGYVVKSRWSPPFAIAPALELKAFSPSVASPRRAGATDIFWNVEATGGVGATRYTFQLDDGERKRMVQAGSSNSWLWSPRVRGSYRVKVTLRDTIGNVVENAWTEPFRIEPALTATTPIVIFPLENLSGHGLVSSEIEEALRSRMVASGLKVLSPGETEAFMVRHRVRHIGGLPASLGRLLEQETGAAAVLMASVEQFTDQDTPRFAMRARLVTTGDKATVLWVDSVALAGHQSPGLLELGRVREVDLLWQQAVAVIVDSLGDQVRKEQGSAATKSTPRNAPRPSTNRRFRPIGFHRSQDLTAGKNVPLRIALLPFVNESARADAGRVMTLHFLEQMTKLSNIEVVEPGDVRKTLLQSRLILEGGPSLPQSDLLRSLLNVDLVISGTVTDYDDPRGEWGDPVVGFWVQAIDSRHRRVGWTSISRGEGGQGVFFFDQGRIYTAHDLAKRMVREVVVRMLETKNDKPEAERP